jgi:hypothetical protein
MMETGAPKGPHSYREMSYADRKEMTLMMTINNPMYVQFNMQQ